MSDLLERLEQLARPKAGDVIALDVGSGTVAEAYSAFVSKACAEALAEIKHLRQLSSDEYSKGYLRGALSFSSIKQEIKNGSSS